MALDICIAKYQPFRGKSYFPTPKYIPPRTVINVKNEDNRCFEWAVLSAIVSSRAKPTSSKQISCPPQKAGFYWNKISGKGYQTLINLNDRI